MRDFLRFAIIPLVLLLPGACGLLRSPPPDESTGSTVQPAAAATSNPAAGNNPGATGNPVYEEALSRWVNHPEEDLVAAWGVPERSQRLTDGGQALEYRRVRDGQVLCTTLFTSDVYGMIRTWTYRGIDCSAPKLGDYSRSS